MSGVADCLRAELERWGTSAIEQEVFGTVEPVAIEALVTRFCVVHFGLAPVEALFYRGSAGAVFGLCLADGRRVVLKVYQERWTASFLAAVQVVQRHLVEVGFSCPRPMLSPRPLTQDVASPVMAESLLADPGMRALAGADDRRASAGGLADQIRLCREMAPDALREHPLRADGSALYPKPHSPLFDFEATANGADWIDEMARRAKEIRDADVGPAVLAHTDWAARNVRVEQGELVAAYDWDSIALVSESVAVGQAALTWSVTSEPGGSIFPDADTVAAYVSDYEQASDRQLSVDQWRAVGGAAAWNLAYIARCEHALDAQGLARSDQHGGRDRLSADGDRLLSLKGGS